MRNIIHSAIAATMIGFSAAAQSEAPTQEYNLDIARQSLTATLMEFSKQTGIDVSYVRKTLKDDRLVGPLKGRYTPDAALRILLAESGLRFRRLNDVTIAVTTGDPDATVTIRETGNGRTSEKFREDGPQISFVRLADPGLLATASDRERQAGDDQVSRGGDRVQGLSAGELEEVLVTGSRLRRNGETPSPVTVFDRSKIDEIGATSVADILQYLPQQPFTLAPADALGGAQFAQLRGLGVDTTLVLINGRRVSPSAPNAAINAFDLNTIPLAAVERVEILSDSASAVYGADAVGGVINVILKKAVPEPVVDLYYGAANGGGEERRVSLSSGYSTERFGGSLVLDYFDRGFLLGEERDLWRDQDYRRFGGLDRRSLTSNPGNIGSRTTGNLPGLPSRTAAVPRGSAGVGLTPADFLATAGQENRASLQRFASVVPETNRRSAAAFVEYEIGAGTTLFGEALYLDRRNEAQLEPTALSNALVPASNAFNPFGVAVSANYLFVGVGPRRQVTTAETVRGVAGARTRLGSWDGEVSLVATDEDAKFWTENAVNVARANAALASSDPAQALNVFQDGPGGSAELLRSLVDAPTIGRFSSGNKQASGYLRGALFDIASGTVDAVVGGEWRREDLQIRQGTVAIDKSRDVSAAFTELSVPLVSPSMSIAGMSELTLSLAGRYDDYGQYGSSFNPQYGLVWKPLSSLSVRASYGESFRPPSQFELFAPLTSFQTSSPDPRRGNEVAVFTSTVGGNEELLPMDAKSLTAGIVFSPRDGLEVSGTYWQVKMERKVSLLGSALLLANEDLFPERVIRAAPSAADIAAGRAGQILSIDSTRINFGFVDTRGVDVSVAYSVSTRVGRFAPSLSGTWVDQYDVVTVPRTPAVDRVDLVASAEGTIPRWSAVGTLAWAWAGVGASVSARHVPSYDDATVFSIRNGRSIPSQTFVDAQVSIELDEFAINASWLKGLKVACGASNLSNEEPSYSEAAGIAGYDRSQGDLRERFYYATVSKTF